MVPDIACNPWTSARSKGTGWVTDCAVRGNNARYYALQRRNGIARCFSLWLACKLLRKIGQLGVGEEVGMRKKLLVVDDEVGITNLITRIATSLEYEVRAVNDPVDAVPAFAAFEPDVVLLDLIMPGIDGIDVLNQILALRAPDSIIVMSGYGQSYLRLGEAVGKFHDHDKITMLAKPFRRAELIALLTPEANSPQP
jgi:CheY-like chemotaxis protein